MKNSGKLILSRELFKKEQLFTLAVIFIPGILFLTLLGLVANMNDIKFGFLSQDPVQILNAKPYIGIISYTGIILWCAAAAILLYSSKIYRIKGAHDKGGSFLFWGGTLTSVLLIDDLFMFHDNIMPVYFNIDDKVFFAFYFLAVIAMAYFFFDRILKSDYILLVLSFVLLGSSGFIDVFVKFGLNVPHSSVLEDGTKFLGIVAWFSYFTRESYRSITSMINDNTEAFPI